MDHDLELTSLRKKQALLNQNVQQEDCYVWKNLVKIEELKKEKSKKKDELLRAHLHCFKHN